MDGVAIGRSLELQLDLLAAQLERTSFLQQRYVELARRSDDRVENLATIVSDLHRKYLKQVAMNESLAAGIALLEGHRMTDLQAAALMMYTYTSVPPGVN